MTLGSESESMTIKRLEIALRKMDPQLLKTAGYKLHEKFHSGHKFHYIPELRQILNFVETEKIDAEISQLISSTIKEILQKHDGGGKNIPEPITIQNTAPQQAEQQGLPVEQHNAIDNIGQTYLEQQTSTDGLIPAGVLSADTHSAPQTQYASYTSGSNPKNIFIYYEEKNSEIDSRLINEYKKTIASNAPVNEAMGCIKRILNVLNTDLSNLNKIFSTFSTLKNKVSFATASMNSNLFAVLDENSIKFKIPFICENYAAGAWKFLPLFGNANIYECPACGNKFLNKNFEQQSLATLCQKCSEPSFPKLDSGNSLDGFIMQSAFDALLNSKIWILINPPHLSNPNNSSENLQIQNLLSLAYKNSTPEKIYILTQDTERKEFYRQMFAQINENCEIKSNYLTDENFCEDFIKTETITRVYS